MMKRTVNLLSLCVAFCVCCGVAFGASVKEHKYNYTVKVNNGVPQIMCNGRPVSHRLFECNPSNLLVEPGPNNFVKKTHPEGLTEDDFNHLRNEYANCRDFGVEIVSLSGCQLLWEDLDVEALKKRLDTIMTTFLEVYPEGKVIPRLILNPPAPWFKKHPNARITFDDGSKGWQAPFESLEYRAALKKALTDTLTYLEEKYGDNLAGYQLGGGQWCEWFYEGYQNYHDKWPCYDADSINAYRVYLTKKYQTDAALQKAWKEPTATLKAATPPPRSRLMVTDRALHCPDEAAWVIDYLDFINSSVADCQIEVAKLVRDTVGEGRLICTFFAYLNATVDPRCGGGARSGHLHCERVMDCPYIDIITSPGGYANRVLGGVIYSQAVAESIMKRGKLYLTEDDEPTHTSEVDSKYGPWFNKQPGYFCKDAADSRMVHRRWMAQCFANNYAFWWMDLHGIGWFEDYAMWPEMTLFQKVEQRDKAKPVPFEPEVALCLDADSVKYMYGAGTGTRIRMFSTSRLTYDALGRAGLPYGHYLAKDVLEGKFPKVKVAYFTDMYAMTGAQRRQMREFMKTHSCVFYYAIGYIDLDTGKFSTDAIEEATGFKVKVIKNVGFGVDVDPEGISKMGFNPQLFPKKFMYDDAVDMRYKDMDYISPIPEPGDHVLARYRTGDPAVVLRVTGKHPQLFTGTPFMPLGVCTEFSRKAGAHVYATCGVQAMVRGDFMAFVATGDGEIQLNLPKYGHYRDLITGRNLGVGKVFKVYMKRGETIVPELFPYKQYDKAIFEPTETLTVGGQGATFKMDKWRKVNADRKQGIDCTATVKASYTESELVLRISVQDDVFHIVNGPNYWDGDSIQLSFSTFDQSGIVRSISTDYILVGSNAPNDNLCFKRQSGAPYVRKQDANFTFNLSDKRHVYIFKVPLAELGLNPKDLFKQRLAMTLLVNDNDNDGKGRRGYLYWGRGAGNGIDPWLHGRISFVK